MRPNIFALRPHCAEDAFSNSLGYILNLVPTIGQQLIERIAELSGKSAGYFGAFERCEFVGHEYAEGHAVSRPDLKITCAKRTLYFENKLESRLNLAQMERHSHLTRCNPSCDLIFVSNIRHETADLRPLPGYLHPRDRDHYLWSDFLSIFASTEGQDSVAGQILADFDAALKARGMIGKEIKGASGSLYTVGSDAAHLALSQLAVLLQEIGFKVSKRARETTIRVYPTRYGTYPLLNPRFEATGTLWDEALDQECIVFSVLSQGDASTLDRHLKKFKSTADCHWVPAQYERSDGYWQHGAFILPTRFVGRAPNQEIGFATLRDPLSRLFAFLRAASRQGDQP